MKNYTTAYHRERDVREVAEKVTLMKQNKIMENEHWIHPYWTYCE